MNEQLAQLYLGLLLLEAGIQDLNMALTVLQNLAQQFRTTDISEIATYCQQLEQQNGREALILNIAQLANGVKAARFGMKINYLKTLRGNCPAGTKLMYYKAGGRICKKCVKEMRGGKTKDDPISEFRKERCGGKMKKKAVGGTVDQPAKYNKGFCKKH